ncbi:unnamed protein product [Staurois parvus]|uniref:Quinolinate phosphoribosyl transferase C-terminal domain-containing protein n=1 Tax=Staurois parvus TaxID=386267 RepID=A0ABN9FF68_9NEOB|nr:unnamed protein product [Staurois parvus]
MLKDNHIWAMGGVREALRGVRSVAGHTLKVEVECRSEKEALEAAESGADIIMLDNFTPEVPHHAALSVKTAYPSVVVEASGGVTPPQCPALPGAPCGCSVHGLPDPRLSAHRLLPQAG